MQVFLNRKKKMTENRTGVEAESEKKQREKKEENVGGFRFVQSRPLVSLFFNRKGNEKGLKNSLSPISSSSPPPPA